MILPKAPSPDTPPAGPPPFSRDEVPGTFRHFPAKLVKWLRGFPGCCVLPVLLGNNGLLATQLARELGLGEGRGVIERLREWLNLLVEMHVLVTRPNPADTREHFYLCLTLDRAVIAWLELQCTWAREQARSKLPAAEKKVASLNLKLRVLGKIHFPGGSPSGG